MNKTGIEWVKNPDGTQGYTWNPITGCLNGCEYCYARKLANGRLKARYLANTAGVAPLPTGAPEWVYKSLNDPFYPRFWEDRLKEPMVKAVIRGRTTTINIGKHKGILVCDMSDLFGIGIPEEWTRRIIQTIEDSPHRLYLLTKQPQNLPQWSPFPDNCWVGVSATTYKQFQDALEGLCQIVARVKYISFEPLLESIEIWHSSKTADNDFTIGGGINWVIIGTQTKPYKPPKIEWVEEIVRACDRAGVKVFLKDNLLPLFEGIGVLPWDRGNYRQEMPK